MIETVCSKMRNASGAVQRKGNVFFTSVKRKKICEIGCHLFREVITPQFFRRIAHQEN